MISLNSFTDDTDAQIVRCSSRATKGSGGQITQLQNLERIQSEQTSSKTSRALQLDVATANEPTNPMAPRKPKPRIKHSSISVRDAHDYLDVGSVGMFPSLSLATDNKIRLVNAHRSLHPLTERPCLHIKQLWKVLGMGFVFQTWKISVEEICILLLPPPFLSDLMGLLLRLLVGALLHLLLVEGLLHLLLMEGLLPRLLVEGLLS